MICLCHEENTVDKFIWKKPEMKIKLPSYTSYEPFLKELGFVDELKVETTDAIKE